MKYNSIKRLFGPRVFPFIPVIINVILGIVLLSISWRKWPDIFVDFGTEVYIPWRLINGDILFKDIAFHNGPLSVYFNALLFKLFGTGILTLALFNILIIILLCFLIYHIFNFIADYFTAFLTITIFLSVFAFNQLTYIGNYNFVTPYSHELTHGITLSFIGIYCLILYLQKPRAWWFVVFGLILGLTFLAKIEIFISLLASFSISFLFIFLKEERNLASVIKSIVFFAAGFVIPIIVCIFLFSLVMPFKEILPALTFAYRTYHINLANRFFRWVTGFSNPVENLLSLINVFLWYVESIAIIGFLSYLLYSVPQEFRKRAEIMAIFACVFVFINFFLNSNYHFVIGRPFPLIIILLIAFVVVKTIISLKNGENFDRHIPLIALGVFAFFLLAKIILNSRLWHYGFGLAMPAGLLITMLMAYDLPLFFEEEFEAKSFSRIIFTSLLLLTAFNIISSSLLAYKAKTYAIGQKGDKIITNPGAGNFHINLDAAVKKLEATLNKNETFIVFPQGVMLNYLARRKNPSRHSKFIPGDFEGWGTEEMLRSVTKSPPDYIVVVDYDTSEHGARYFGIDYGQEVWDWISKNYTPMKEIGKFPHGIIIAKKNPPSQNQSP